MNGLEDSKLLFHVVYLFMECLYAPNLERGTQAISLIGEEAQHARALRLRTGEYVLLSNGCGLCAEALVEDLTKNELRCNIRLILPDYNELSYHSIVALGILDNRERMEFALEKAIELGATDFVPLLTHHSEHNRTRPERLIAKALSAMKQTHRARLTKIHAPMSPKALLQMIPAQTTIILADAEGNSPSTYSAENVCLCVGPEGGFSDEEQVFFSSYSPAMRWRLAPTRLRAETALIAGVSALTLFHK